MEVVRKRVKRRLILDSPKVINVKKEQKQLVLAKIDLNKGERRPNYRDSVQMNTFMERRVKTESFLQAMEEKY